MNRIKEYLPSLAMVVAAALSVFVSAAADNRLSADEVGNIALAILGAVVTYIVPRFATVLWLKPLVASVTAALQFALSVWGDGITMSEWAQIILTALGAAGVLLTNKNVPVYPPGVTRQA